MSIMQNQSKPLWPALLFTGCNPKLQLNFPPKRPTIALAFFFTQHITTAVSRNSAWTQFGDLKMQIRLTEIYSTNDWEADPDLVEVDFPEQMLHKAECCVKYMKENGIHKMVIWYALGFKLYRDAQNLDEDELQTADVRLDYRGVEYVVFEPKYQLEGCHVELFHDGDIKGVLKFRHTDDRITALIGDVNSLRSQFDTLTEGA